MNFAKRSYQKELLDGENIPFTDIAGNMKELNTINSWLGGHRASVKGLQNLLPFTLNSPVHICEIGCGGGDNLSAVKNWCEKNNIASTFTGIDINDECIRYARQQSSPEIRYIISDYRNVKFENKPDILFSSLFCHHFNEIDIGEILDWCSTNSSTGFFINDLHRHPLAYHSIKVITTIFSGSYLVKNDAPISVLRGFTREEWLNLLKASDIKKFSIEWRLAFRWLITVINEPSKKQEYISTNILHEL